MRQKTGQTQLFDTKTLYIEDDGLGFEVKNMYDFTGEGLSAGPWKTPGEEGGHTKEEIIKEVCFEQGILSHQIKWLTPEQIPREKRKCPKCKEIKMFDSFEIKEYAWCPKTYICMECFIYRFLSEGFFEKHYDAATQKVFLKQMEMENNVK